MNNVLPVNGENRKRSLLVVDDNPTMRLLLKHVLKTKYQVETASCVDEALRLAQEKPFDALARIIHNSHRWGGLRLDKADPISLAGLESPGRSPDPRRSTERSLQILLPGPP